MSSGELEKELSDLQMTSTSDPQCEGKSNLLESRAVDDSVQITCFTEILHDTTVHFQIIRLAKQEKHIHTAHGYLFWHEGVQPVFQHVGFCFVKVIAHLMRNQANFLISMHSHSSKSSPIYAWIGCNTAKLGHLYAAAATRPSNMVSVTSLLGVSADSTGSSIARHLVMKTGLSLILACNIPKDSPMLEVAAERKLLEKLRSLGYIKPKS